MSDYGGKFEEDFFPETSIIHIEADILNELWEELHAEFFENEWSEQDGIRYALAAGLSFLRAERLREEIENGTDPEPRLERMLRERMELDGRYAVMKYRTYQFLQDAKTLSMRLNVCQMQLDALRIANKELHEKLERKS
jgi:hypothetical protein